MRVGGDDARAFFSTRPGRHFEGLGSNVYEPEVRQLVKRPILDPVDCLDRDRVGYLWTVRLSSQPVTRELTGMAAR
jgi:hypothetical protein